MHSCLFIRFLTGRLPLSVFLFSPRDADVRVDRELGKGKQAASGKPSPRRQEVTGRQTDTDTVGCIRMCACACV